MGKIPSAFNAQGQAHGLKDWQKREILPNELALWRKDPRLNICVRLGEISGVYAIDVDVDDPEKTPSILTIIEAFMGKVPRRSRSNSGKFLVPFRMEEGCTKRIIKLDNAPKGPRIELLANGQQFVAAGTHSSGVRYTWPDGLPSILPSLTLATLNNMWLALSTRFATSTGTTMAPTTPHMTPSGEIPGTDKTSNTGDQTLQTSIDEDSWLQLRAALRFMLDKVPTNDDWSELGYALLSLQHARPARQLWIEFSRKAVGYEEGAPEQWWDAHYQQTPRSDFRHVFTIARGYGWGKSSSPDAFTPIEKPAPSPDSPPDDMDMDPIAAPERPIIRLADKALLENLNQLEMVLKPEVYSQGGLLARVSREYVDDDIKRTEDQPRLISVSPTQVRTLSMERADFLRYDGRKAKVEWVPCSCPPELAIAFLSLGQWTALRPLEAIARAPFVRPDGSICDVAGYDPRARALYIPNLDYPPVPGEPGMDDARAALGRLLDPFDQFPWYDSASRSAFAAHILTEAARIAVSTSPMFWYTAPTAGTGKSLLSVMPSLIVHGNEPAMRPWVVDGEELRKTLFASLLAGDRSIAFDNVPNGYKARAPELCAFLTSAIWQDRKLGASETHAIPNRSVVSASGNNVTPVSDLARRSVVVRIDANSAEMKQRRFKISNLREYVMEHRSQMLVDALTIIKAYGIEKPDAGVALPSFERWSRMCRAPLIWLGMADPCDTQSETDDESAGVEAIFVKLVAYFGNRPFAGMDIAKLAGGMADSDGELSALLMQAGCTDPNSALKIGYWLREQRDKLGAGHKLVSGERGAHGVRWQLKPINGDLA